MKKKRLHPLSSNAWLAIGACIIGLATATPRAAWCDEEMTIYDGAPGLNEQSIDEVLARPLDRQKIPSEWKAHLRYVIAVSSTRIAQQLGGDRLKQPSDLDFNVSSADIDGDGKPELITRASLYTGGGSYAGVSAIWKLGPNGSWSTLFFEELSREIRPIRWKGRYGFKVGGSGEDNADLYFLEKGVPTKVGSYHAGSSVWQAKCFYETKLIGRDWGFIILGTETCEEDNGPGERTKQGLIWDPVSSNFVVGESLKITEQEYQRLSPQVLVPARVDGNRKTGP